MPSESSPRSFAFSMRIGAPPFPTGTVAPTGAKGYFLPGRDIGRATHHLAALGAAIVDRAHAQAVGVRVLAHLLDQRHPDVAKPRVEWLDHVDRGALGGEAGADVLRIERPPQEALEPAPGDVHGASLPGANCDRKRMSPS